MEPVLVGRPDQVQRDQSGIHRQKDGQVNPELLRSRNWSRGSLSVVVGRNGSLSFVKGDDPEWRVVIKWSFAEVHDRLTGPESRFESSSSPHLG